MNVVEQSGHRYYVQDGGRHPYDSVTTVLGTIWRKQAWIATRAEFEGIDTMAYYLKRGRYVHKAAQIIASGQKIDWKTVDDDFAESVRNFERWLGFYSVDRMEPELIVRSDKFRFAGREDLPCYVDGTPYDVDIKSGGKDALVGPQTAMYRQARREMYNDNDGEATSTSQWLTRRRGVLYLSNERYEFVPLTDTNDFQHALNALAAYRSGQQLGVYPTYKP